MKLPDICYFAVFLANVAVFVDEYRRGWPMAWFSLFVAVAMIASLHYAQRRDASNRVPPTQ